MIAVGILFLLLFLVLGVGSLVIWIWGIVDAAGRPEWVFNRAGSNKVMWIVLMAVLGAIPALIYFLSVRRRLEVAQASGAMGYPQLYGSQPAWGPPAAGWYPDPAGRHWMRYWNGLEWTSSISDGGATFHDPLTP